MANDWQPLRGGHLTLYFGTNATDAVERWYALRGPTGSRTSAPAAVQYPYWVPLVQRVRIHDIRLITQNDPGSCTVRTYLDLSASSTHSASFTPTSWNSQYMGYQAFDDWVIEVPDGAAQLAMSLDPTNTPGYTNAVIRLEYLRNWKDGTQ